MDWSYWENNFEHELTKSGTVNDPAHDILHFRRVVKIAKELCHQESACLEVVIPAAWLHDLVIIPKDSLLRKEASKLSAQKAREYLRKKGYPEEYLDGIAHSIEAHSFSANIEPKTIEAKIVQDADRLDALGAIGIARCFATSGLLKRPFYHHNDPFCIERQPDDSQNTIDHFYIKLFKIADSLKTSSGQKEGMRRAQEMKHFLDVLASEIDN